METAKQLANALAFLFGIPALAALSSWGFELHLNGEFAEDVLQAPQNRLLHLSRTDIPSVIQACATNAANLREVCDVQANVQLLATSALWTACAAFLLIVIIWCGAQWSRHHQSRLAWVFTAVLMLTLVFVVLFVLAEGMLLTATSALAEVILFHSFPGYVTVSLGIAAFGASFAVLISTLELTGEFVTQANGVEATRSAYPELWSFIDSVAAKIGARPPEHIVLGLDVAFYATGASIQLAGTEERLTGETMYLSLPLMRVLSRAEFAAVVGHELGHFKGRDCVYTLRFVPAFRGLTDALALLSDGPIRPSAWLMSLPAKTVLKFCLDEFTKTEREISRERELEADRSGALASDPQALISALIKLAIFSPIWPMFRSQIAALLTQGTYCSNMSAVFAHNAKQLSEKTRAESSNLVLTSRQPHPTDTHPPLEARARALNVSIDELRSFLTISEERASALISGIEGLENALSLHAQRQLIMSGRAHIPRGPNAGRAPMGAFRSPSL